MHPILVLAGVIMAAGPIQFERHDIDSFPAGYQVAVADVNGDGKPDVIALSTEANQVDWYENPTWKRRPIVRTPRPIDLAVRDIDGNGQVEIAVGAGFFFSESTRGGDILVLHRAAMLQEPWIARQIAADPVVHRLRWADLDGDGRPELVHAPIFGPGSQGPRAPKPAHLWAFRPPRNLAEGSWDPWKIDETLAVLHGIYVGDLDQDGRDEILTASYEGIWRFDFEGQGPTAAWRKVRVGPGAPPGNDVPGASRGASEVAAGKLANGRRFIASIEPWHGNQVVVYTPSGTDSDWTRQVLDDGLSEGHALLVADFDGDGADEIVAGWRGAGGGLALYDPAHDGTQRFTRVPIDHNVPAEGAVAADINADGRLDLVVVAGRTNTLAWYENRAAR